MVMKRFLSIVLAGLIVVTSINSGNVKAYASDLEADSISITDQEEETADYLVDEVQSDTVIEDQQENEADDSEELVIDDSSLSSDSIVSEEEEDVFVTFNARGGFFENEEGTLEVKTKMGEVLIDSIDPPVKDGYRFDGWFLDEELTREVDLRTYIFTENSVLYAAWQEQSTGEGVSAVIEDYSITLDANGGEFPDGNETIVYVDNHYVAEWAVYLYLTDEKYKPTKEGKLFIGWYADKECKNLLSQTDAQEWGRHELKEHPENGSTIYAGWVDFVTITYVFGTETGTDPLKNTGYCWDSRKEEKVKKVQLAVPVGTAPGTSDDYYPNTYKASRYYDARNSDFHYGPDFKWYSDEDRTNEVDLESDACKAVKDVTYYAGYEEKFYLLALHSLDTTGYFTLPHSYYYGEDGKYETMVRSVLKEYSPYNGVELYKDDDKIQNSIVKRGIEGYYTDEEGKNKAVEFGDEDDTKYFRIDKDTDLYVKFADTKNVITFDANGGYIFNEDKPEDHSKKVDQQVYKFGDSVSITPLHVKNTDLHKCFMGWSTDKNAVSPEFEADSEDDCVKNMDITITGDVTYYAIWEDKYHVITLDAGDGTFSYTDPLTGLRVDNVKKAEFRTNQDGYYNGWIYDPDYKDDTKVFSSWVNGDKQIKEIYHESFSEDCTLTAEYIPSYTITFNSGAGTFGYHDENYHWIKNVTTEKFKTNGKRRLSIYPTYVEPYDSNTLFEAWYDGDRKIEHIDDEVFTQDTTLTAKYVKIYTITFDAGNGTFSYYNGETVTGVSKAVLKTRSDRKLRGFPYDEKATEAGKVFAGWSIDGEIIDEIRSYIFTSDTTVIAKYDDINAETAIEISPDTLKLSVDEEASVSAIVTPSSKADSVTWTSSNKKVATVTGSGSSATIKGVAKGTATIKAKVDNKTATVKVTVTKAPIALSETSVILAADPATKRELTATLNEDNKDKTVLWTSSEPALVAVTADSGDSKKAVLDPVDEIDEEKEAVITATIEGTTLAATCTVIVRPASGAEAPKADVPSGSTVKKGTLVSLTTKTPGADIFYTVDETEPATKAGGSTEKYTDAFAIDKDMTIKAVAYKEGLKPSTVSVLVYSIDRDWGDVDSAWFDGKYDDIPDDVWYLIDGKVYTYHGAIDNYKPTYNGGKITFNDKVLVFHHTRKLVESRDYSLTFSNNTNVGTGRLNIKGKGVYASTAAFTFNIDKEDINNAVINSETLVTIIAGKKKLSSVKPTLTYNEKALKVNKDYKVTYSESATTVLNDPDKTYTITIEGIGNFSDKIDKAVTVETLKNDTGVVAVSSLKVGDSKGKAYSKSYDGNPVDIAALFQNGTLVVTNKQKKILEYDKDYKIEALEEDNTSAGKHCYLVQGIKKTEDGAVSYIGQKTCTYEIKGIDLKKAKVEGLKKTVYYTGEPIEENELGSIVLKDGATKKPIDPDNYEVVCDNTGTVGKLNVFFVGKNGATGTLKKTVNIKAYKIPEDKLTVTVNNDEPVYFVKTGAKPPVTVKFGDTTLIEGSDYKVTYKQNNKAGTASVVIKGLANYAGTSKTQPFTIEKADVSRVDVVANDVVYKPNGKAGYFLVKPKLMDDGKAISVGKNKDIEALPKKDTYTYTYYDTGAPVGKNDKIEAGTIIAVTVTVNCSTKSSYYSESGGTVITGLYRVVKSDLSKAKIKVKDDSKSKLVVSNGEAVKLLKSDLNVTVGGTLLEPDDYDIVSITNNKQVGTSTLSIRGKGNFGGTKSATFKISARKLK